MNKNSEFNIDDIKAKSNKLIGKILSFVIVGIAGFKLNNILSSPSSFFKLFYTNIYKNFHSYSYMSRELWVGIFIFYLIGTTLGIIFLVKALLKKNFLHLLVCLFMIFLFIMSLSTSVYSIEAIKENRNTSDNIEIIRPYISNDEYILLKSNYLQINSKKDFETVNDKIRDVAKKYDANINQNE